MRPTVRALLIELTIVILVSLLLALLGPYGSYEAPLAHRLIYWLSLGVGGFLIFRPAMAGAAVVARTLDLPDIATWSAACLAAAAPMTLIVWFASPAAPSRLPTASNALSLYVNVAVIAAAVTMIFWFLRGPRREAPQPAQAPTGTPSTARFLDRLPAHLGRDLLALEMEDHYVRVHTPSGSTLILMRMRDAVAELDGLDGLQVHRSWWVARSAVAGEVQDGRNLRLRLKNGLEAPVARSSVAGLRAEGWLK